MEPAFKIEREYVAILRSTKVELESFLASSVWHDLYNEFSIWIEDIQTQLEIETDKNVLRKLQGNIEAVRRAQELPNRLIFSLKEMEKEDG